MDSCLVGKGSGACPSMRLRGGAHPGLLRSKKTSTAVAARLGIVLLLTAAPLFGQTILDTIPGTADYQVFGKVIDVAGDVDGDGRDDLIIGTPDHSTVGMSNGAAFLVSGFDGSLLHSFHGEAASYRLGSAVAGGLDVDGDGVPDVILGAPYADHNFTDSGSAYVHSGADGSLIRRIDGFYFNSRMGTGVGLMPDINGDGLAETVVSNPDTNSTALFSRVIVHSGADGAVLLTIDGPPSTVIFGERLDVSGDMDGDGGPEILVGTPDLFRVEVYSGLDGHLVHTFQGEEQDDYGVSLAAVGDLDGDGRDDLVIGAPKDSSGFERGGAAHAYSGMDGQLLFTVLGQWERDELGTSVGPAGDPDGDGQRDLVLGAPKADSIQGNGDDRGRFVIVSGADGSVLHAHADPTSEAGDALGCSVTGGGDFNGDGFDDVAAGLCNSSLGGDHSGAVQLVSIRYRAQGLTPDAGLFQEPTAVVLSGSGFDTLLPAEVWFGDQPATDVVVVDASTVTCLAPPGDEDEQVPVVFMQDGLTVAPGLSFTHEGTTLTGFDPDHGPKPGGTVVTLIGRHFPDDGSLAVTFGAEVATVIEVESPTVAIVEAPPYPDQYGVLITVTSSQGSDVSDETYHFQSKWLDVERGNLTGGTVVTAAGELVLTDLADTTVTVGGVQALVLDLGSDSVTFVTPGVPAATGLDLNVRVDNSTGSQQITTPFLYTPTLQASFEGSTPQGGVLSLEFTTDPAATGPQFAWLWLASFTGPDLNHPVDGWAGLFHHPIALFVLFGAPLPEGQLQYPVPVVPSEAAGVVFRLQGAVSGEGGLEGSLTNTTTFSIPIGP